MIENQEEEKPTYEETLRFVDYWKWHLIFECYTGSQQGYMKVDINLHELLNCLCIHSDQDIYEDTSLIIDRTPTGDYIPSRISNGRIEFEGSDRIVSANLDYRSYLSGRGFSIGDIHREFTNVR